MRIAIRADGGSKIGMGHIMRTLVLAKELSIDNDVFYVCRVDNRIEDLRKIADAKQLISVFLNDEIEDINEIIFEKYAKGIEKVVREGFKVFTISENHLIDELKNIDADFLITDSYDVNEEYFNVTKKIFSKTAYIDDINLYNFNVDFLINQNIDAEDFKYSVNTDTKLMLGSRYVMLRDEFRSAKTKIVKSKVSDVMITLGGADPHNITKNIIQWVSKLEYRFHVVVGPSFSNIDELKKLEDDKIKLYFNADMYSIMKKSDIAISACGSTLYELCACGVPTIGIIVVENQLGIANKMSDLGIIKLLGWYDNINRDHFIRCLVNIAEDFEWRKNTSKAASSIIDGKGVYRICENFKKANFGGKL